MAWKHSYNGSWQDSIIGSGTRLAKCWFSASQCSPAGHVYRLVCVLLPCLIILCSPGQWGCVLLPCLIILCSPGRWGCVLWWCICPSALSAASGACCPVFPVPACPCHLGDSICTVGTATTWRSESRQSTTLSYSQRENEIKTWASPSLTYTVYLWIVKDTTTVCCNQPHPTGSQMSTVHWWSGASVPNQRGPAAAPTVDLLHRFCQTWALTVNLSKTKNIGVPKMVQ